MWKLFRLVALVAVGAVLVAGGLTGVAVAASGAVNKGGSSKNEPLLPLTAALAQPSTVYAADGSVLATFRASVNRYPIPLSGESPLLIRAVLDTEDERFYIHGGFDIPSTFRALASDSSSGGGLQGGSTITQQLVKQLYQDKVRKLSVKIQEAVLADRYQKKYTKNQLLEAYLNIVYLGNSAYGMQAAALAYFNVNANALTLPEAALLAGLIQDPNGYDPILNPAAARQRRSQVLSRMVHYGDITQAQADAANATPLPTGVTQPPTTNDTVAGYYTAEVRSELLNSPTSPLGSTYNERYQALYEGGLKIYTNLNPTLQYLAEQTVAADTPNTNGKYQEALVTIDPATGNVLDMVGGTSFASSNFDIVTQGRRQPGSGFKLFSLLAALQDDGDSPYDTINGYGPCAIAFPGNNDLLKKPINNDVNGGGATTLINATAQSINCAFIRLGYLTGLPAVISMAQSLGITEPIPAVPAMLIGTTAVPPIQIAAAYATVAADGVYHTPTFINHIVNVTGQTIYNGESPGKQIFSAQVAREADLALEQTLVSGTAAGENVANHQGAGKTGTTENSVDAWFNGFVPQLETTVWMGNLQSEIPVYINGAEVYGANYPAKTWHDFMTAALAGVPPTSIPGPDTSAIPKTKFLTSPSLERNDHSAGANIGSSPSTGRKTKTTAATRSYLPPVTPAATTLIPGAMAAEEADQSGVRPSLLPFESA